MTFHTSYRLLLAAVVSATFAPPVHGQPATPVEQQDDGQDAPAKPRTTVADIPIGKDTTRIEGPFRADGAIDYLAALNQTHRKGVTPANNAAVPFWQVMGPKFLDEVDRAAFYEQLGAAPPQANDLRWRTFEEVVAARHPQLDSEGRHQTDEQRRAALAKPWRRGDYPDVAAWISVNEKPLQRILEGLARERFYTPLLLRKQSSQITDDSRTLIEVSLPHANAAREVGRLLAARTMLKVGDGKLDDAWRDLHRAHRLARRIGATAATVVGGLTASALEGQAIEGDYVLAQQGLTSAQALRARADLARLPPLLDFSRLVDRGERFMCLDVVQKVAQDQDLKLAGIEHRIAKILLGRPVDWSVPMTMLNEQLDQIVKIMRIEPYAEQRKASEAWEEELKKHAGPNFIRIVAAVASSGPAKAIGREIGNALVNLLLPTFAVVEIVERQGQTQAELVNLCFALADYKARHGQYPERLKQLTPSLITALPKDRYSGGDLLYRRDGKGYRLYAVGPNLKDDGGVGLKDRKNNEDDIAVHAKR